MSNKEITVPPKKLTAEAGTQDPQPGTSYAHSRNTTNAPMLTVSDSLNGSYPQAEDDYMPLLGNPSEERYDFGNMMREIELSLSESGSLDALVPPSTTMGMGKAAKAKSANKQPYVTQNANWFGDAYFGLKKAGGSSGLLMDLAANEKSVHADFFNDFEDLFDDEDLQ